MPDADQKTKNCLVSSIIASRVHEKNFVVIVPCQESAKHIWRALSAAGQNNTAGGLYMQLEAMMTTQAESDEDVSKVIGTMDVI